MKLLGKKVQGGYNRFYILESSFPRTLGRTHLGGSCQAEGGDQLVGGLEVTPVLW